MKKRIISLSLGLLFMFNSVGLLVSKSVAARTQKVARKNDYMISVPGKEFAAMVKKLKAQEAQLKTANDQLKTAYTFIQNNRLLNDFSIYQLKLLPKNKKLAQIKKLVDAGVQPKDVQIVKYRIGLIPFSEIEPVLSTLSIGQLRPILSSALKNGEIDEARAKELQEKIVWSHMSPVEQFNYYGKKVMRYATLAIPVGAAALNLYNSPQGARPFKPLMKAFCLLALRGFTGLY